MSDMSTNPYAVSTTALGDASLAGGAEAITIRNRFLSHEASVKSVGLLYWLGGVVGCLLAVAYFFGGMALLLNQDTLLPGVVTFILSFVVGIVAALQIVLAQGLRNLKPWARIATAVLSGIGLLGFPIGTLISAYIMYLMLSQKGQYVFSPEYQRVIAATPHIKYKTSIIVWILLGLVGFFIVLGLVSVLLTR